MGTEDPRASFGEPGAAKPRRSPLRNPYIWAFFIGIVTVTAMRPLLRREPPPPPVLGQVPTFALMDQHGAEFGDSDLSGHVYVANFFFTSCPSVCLTLTDAMSRLQQRYEENGIDQIRLVSISVDPQVDTPERLREYAERHGVEPARWRLLTGELSEVRDLVEKGFKVPMGNQEPFEGGLYDIAHSGKFVLVDRGGAIRGYYDVLDREDMYPGYEGSVELGVDEIFHRSRQVLKEKER